MQHSSNYHYLLCTPARIRSFRLRRKLFSTAVETSEFVKPSYATLHKHDAFISLLYKLLNSLPSPNPPSRLSSNETSTMKFLLSPVSVLLYFLSLAVAQSGVLNVCTPVPYPIVKTNTRKFEDILISNDGSDCGYHIFTSSEKYHVFLHPPSTLPHFLTTPGLPHIRTAAFPRCMAT